MSSVPGRQTGRLQALPAGLSPFPTRRYTHIPGTTGALSPRLIRPTPLASGQLLWLKRIKDDSLLSLSFFFHPLSWLLFSFHAGWKASQTPTPCTYHSGQDTQEVYVLHGEEEGWGGGEWGGVGSGGGKEGGRSAQREKGGMKGGGGSEWRAKCKSCEAHENKPTKVGILFSFHQLFTVILLFLFSIFVLLILIFQLRSSIWWGWQEQNSSLCWLFWNRRLVM